MIENCGANYPPPKKNNSYSLMPIGKGERACEPEHTWGPGVRFNYIVHYIIDGKGLLYSGPERYALKKGQMFVIFPGTIVKYVADKTDPWHYTWIAFYGDEAAEVFEKIGVSVKNPILDIQNGSQILELMRQMPTERSADIQRNLMFSAQLYEFMSLLFENKRVAEDHENLYYTAAVRYIKAHYFEEDITIEEIASHIGISRKYLFAVFKRATGESPKEYLLQYRIKCAKNFLSDPHLSIGAVAYSVGYRDPLNFSKIFKSKIGVSPSEYRQSLRKE